MAAFIDRHQISEWPSLLGCGYRVASGGSVIGLVLRVDPPDRARGRWATGCHVAPNHFLTGWPEARAGGTYVVAARALDPDVAWVALSRPMSTLTHLEILGMLGTEPDCASCIRQALEQICAGVDPDTTEDEDCVLDAR